MELNFASAVNVGATSATLSSAVNADGDTLISGKYGFTIDGDNSAKEFIVCDLVGTALTNVQSINLQGAATSGFANYHRIGATVTITDWAILQRMYNNLTGVTGFDSGTPLIYDGQPLLSDPDAIPTVQFVLDTASGGAVSINRQIIAAVAGEAVSAGDWVYYNRADGEWYLTDADDITKSVNVQIGKAIGSGTNGNPITGGVFVSGVENVGTYVAGTTYYLSNTAGALATSAGTNSVVVGVGDANTSLILRQPAPSQFDFLYGVTGMILPYASSTPPAGFLNCDGSAVSRTTYAALFAVTSTNYGVGDGTTTFNLPNLLGRVPVGYASVAPTKVLTFASRSSNVITITGIDNHAQNQLQTGQTVLYTSSGTNITGLTSGNSYFVIRVAYNQFSLAASLGDANYGTAIALSSDGSGTQTFTVTYTARPLGQNGGTETQTSVASHYHTGVQATGSGTSGWSSSGNRNPLTGETGSATPNNIPPFTVVNYIIKT